jgi:hypothetical protein
MAERRQVTCINKRDRTSAHERIRNIGGMDWKMSQTDAIAAIEAGKYSYYVSAGGSIVDVVVATKNDNKYLKTTADGEQPDNLLSLPECS